MGTYLIYMYKPAQDKLYQTLFRGTLQIPIPISL